MLVDDEIWEKGVLESVEHNGKTTLSTSGMGAINSWNRVSEADFSKNKIPYIDESIVSNYNFFFCMYKIKLLVLEAESPTQWGFSYRRIFGQVDTTFYKPIN